MQADCPAGSFTVHIQPVHRNGNAATESSEHLPGNKENDPGRHEVQVELLTEPIYIYIYICMYVCMYRF